MNEEKKKYRDWFDKLKETDIAAAPEEEVEAGIDMTHYRYSFSLIIENNESISRVIIKKLQQLMRNDSRIPDWAFSEQTVTENNNLRIDGVFNYEPENPEQVLLFMSALAKIICYRIGLDENTNRNIELKCLNTEGRSGGCTMLTVFNSELKKWATLADTETDSTDEKVTSAAGWFKRDGEMLCELFGTPLQDIPGTKFENKILPYVWSIKNRQQLWMMHDKKGNWFKDIPVMFGDDWEYPTPNVRIYGKDVLDLYHRFMVFLSSAYELEYDEYAYDTNNHKGESFPGIGQIANIEQLSDTADFFRGVLVYKHRMTRIYLNGQYYEGRVDPEVKEIVRNIKLKAKEHPDSFTKKIAVSMLSDYVRQLPDQTLLK